MSGPTGELTLPPGSDPALDYARPDIELRVRDVLRELGGVQVWLYALQEGDPHNWITYGSLQVDVRASSKGAALRRADLARRRVMAMPNDVDWAEGQVARVDCIDGPFWLPDSPTGGPRYVARYRITFRPARR